MRYVLRTTIELPFVLDLANEDFDIVIDDEVMTVTVANGWFKLVRWPDGTKAKDEGPLINFWSSYDDLERLLKVQIPQLPLKGKDIPTDPRLICYEPCMTLVMTTRDAGSSRPRKPDRVKAEDDLLKFANRLIDVYRVVGLNEPAAGKAWRTGWANLTNATHELFRDEVSPETYSEVHVAYKRMQQDEYFRRPIEQLDGTHVERLKELLASQIKYPLPLQLVADSRSLWVREEYAFSVILALTAADIQSSATYQTNASVLPPVGPHDFPGRNRALCNYYDEQGDPPICDEWKLRNRVVHDGYLPTKDEALRALKVSRQWLMKLWEKG